MKAERAKHPDEIDWCHIHRVAREGRGCDQCLDETGGYATHIYVPKDSASELSQLRSQLEQEVARLRRIVAIYGELEALGYPHANRDAAPYKDLADRLEALLTQDPEREGDE